MVNVFDELFQYNVRGNFTSARSVADITKTPNTPEQSDRFHISVEKSEAFYSKRYGTLIGPVEVIVTIRPLKGKICYIF